MSEKGINYEDVLAILEKARKSPWIRAVFLGGIAWLLYQGMFIWGLALFVIYWRWIEECISSESRAEYYEKAFDRLEKTGKHTWNWAAFFGGITWLLYRRMYLYAFVLTIVYFGMDILLGIYAVSNMGGESGMLAAYVILCELVLPRMSLGLFVYSLCHLADKFVYYFANGWVNIENCEIWIIIALSVFITTRICLGYFGNSWYYGEVKEKIYEGYHLMDRFSPTSILSCFGSVFFLLGLISPSSSKIYTINKENIRAYLRPTGKKHVN